MDTGKAAPVIEIRVAGRATRAVSSGSAGAPGVPSLGLLERVVTRDERVRLLCEALATVASLRDGKLFLEMLVQDWSGDTDPAATVGPRFSLSVDAAWRHHRRVRLELQRLAADEQRYAPIADLPMVA